MPGLTLGKYEIDFELGRGGMGVVYLAQDTSLGRRVALKVVHPSLQTDPEFIGRFEHEARSVARLSHPNIVHVNAFDTVEGQLVVDMPCLIGGSLREQMSGPGLTPAQLVAARTGILPGNTLYFTYDDGLTGRELWSSRGASLDARLLRDINSD